VNGRRLHEEIGHLADRLQDVANLRDHLGAQSLGELQRLVSTASAFGAAPHVKSNSTAMRRKSFGAVEVKGADSGEVRAVFSTFNTVDSDGDVTLPGAFRDGQEVRISAYGAYATPR
jgi:hypothetical protein